MSISSEISRLSSAKGDIATAITAKGVSVPSGTKLDGMATLIGQISGGGGEAWAAISVTYPAGSTCTATNGTTTLTSSDTSGTYLFSISQPASTPETWTVSCTDGTHSDSIQVSISTHYEIKYAALDYISTTLDENSWATISRVAQAGTGDTYWDVGDKKEITLNGAIGDYLTLTNFTTYVFILDFNHADNGVADNNIIFGGFKTENNIDIALTDSKYNIRVTDGSKCFNMNHITATNYGGWRGCDLRCDILGACFVKGDDGISAIFLSPPSNTLMAALPNEFRSVLKLHTHYVDNVGRKSTSASNVTAVTDAGAFLLAEYEITGQRSYANSYEQNKQTQMSYYKNGMSKIRYKSSDTTTVSDWMTSSPVENSTYYFVGINSSGFASPYVYTDYSRGLAPAFKV